MWSFCSSLITWLGDIVTLYFWWADYYDCNTTVTSGTAGRAGVKTGLSTTSFATSTYLLLLFVQISKYFLSKKKKLKHEKWKLNYPSPALLHPLICSSCLSMFPNIFFVTKFKLKNVKWKLDYQSPALLHPLIFSSCLSIFPNIFFLSKKRRNWNMKSET